jgi:DNA-binding NarL/FixJ family response regulator
MESKKVLLVEDSPLIQECLRQVLSDIGGLEIVHVAPTAALATEWLASDSAEWDLAVIDIFLRQGHGFEVLRRCVREDPARPAVLLSNYTREPVRTSAAALGADAVFDKVFELDAFYEYCARFAAQSTHPAVSKPVESRICNRPPFQEKPRGA